MAMFTYISYQPTLNIPTLSKVTPTDVWTVFSLNLQIRSGGIQGGGDCENEAPHLPRSG